MPLPSRSGLSPRQVGAAFGVAESTVRRWCDDGHLSTGTTTGGHRRITAESALRLARARGLPLLRPDLLALAAPQLSRADFTAAFLAGDQEQVRVLALSYIAAGGSPTTLFDGPMASALHDLGETHGSDVLGIASEHAAVVACLEAVAAVRRAVATSDAQAPVAIGGAPSGDPYRLPSAMVSTVLAAQGWRSLDLGADLPAPSLLAAATQHAAGLIWLSVSIPVVDAAPYHLLAEHCQTYGIRLMVGGRAHASLHGLGGAIYCRTLADLAAALPHPTQPKAT